jgi:hypothetical protein
LFLDFLSNDYSRGRNILILATVSSKAFLIFPRALSSGFGFMATFVRIESRFLARDFFGLAFFGVVLVLFRIYSVSFILRQTIIIRPSEGEGNQI